MESGIFSVLWIVIAIFIAGSDGLKDVRLEAPRFVRRGEDVTLSCKYDKENDGLYAVKWYRNSEEFYRFVPKEVPPQQVFSEKGITVDDVSSNETFLFIKNVQLDNTGKYKCVVSAEQTFQTLEDVKDITVVAISHDAPEILTEQMTYHPGDDGRANCTVGKSSHLVNITWSINDREVKGDAAKTVAITDTYDPKLVKTLSTLQFKIPVDHSFLRLRCTAQLFDVYLEQTSVLVSTLPRRFSSSNRDTQILPVHSSSSAGARPHCFIIWAAVILIIASHSSVSFRSSRL